MYNEGFSAGVRFKLRMENLRMLDRLGASHLCSKYLYLLQEVLHIKAFSKNRVFKLGFRSQICF